MQVSLEVTGTTLVTSVDSNGSETFSLSATQLFNVSYRVIVEQVGSWLRTVGGNCEPTYQVNLDIP